MQEYDVVVIGAGIFGIAAATAWLDAHPASRLVLVERDSCPGGTWNARRLYDTFWSQIGHGMAEFSDMPMPRPPEEDIDQNNYMAAKYVTRYLETYLEQHMYAGRSLKDRLLLNMEVARVRKGSNAWAVTGKSTSDVFFAFRAHKVIVATGLTSAPQMPEFPGQPEFEGLIAHQQDFGSSGVLASQKYQNVSILGGAKSAADMVYASVKAGKKVSWIVRASGAGPAAFVSGQGNGTYKNAAESGATRFLASMSPSIFLRQDWWTWFVHRTRVGRWLGSQIWKIATARSRSVFLSPPKGAKPCFQSLRPSVDIFWANGALGLVLQDDFWDTVAKNVDVYRCDIERLEPKAIRFSNGTCITADAILCGTGWHKVHSIFDDAASAELGLPHRASDTEIVEGSWKTREARQDEGLLQAFPKLQRSPTPAFEKPKRQLTPFRLFNLIAPISERQDRSIAFVGCIQVPNAFRPSEIQAMWTTLFLDGSLDVPSQEAMCERVAKTTAWNKRRYLDNGAGGIYLHYDTVGYTDMLLDELGLADAEARPAGWWKDLTMPAFPRGLSPVRDAFKGKYMKDKGDMAALVSS